MLVSHNLLLQNIRRYERQGLVSPEHNTLQVEWVLDDARGGDSNPQHVLLGRQVAWVSDPVQCIQVAAGTERKDHDVHLSRQEASNLRLAASFTTFLSFYPSISVFKESYWDTQSSVCTCICLLFSGVGQLVLPPPIVALLDSWVVP